MENQKLENQLNLALDVSEENRMESGNLSTGFEPMSKRWELIVKYSGNLKRYETEDLTVEELIAGYAIVTLPQQMIQAFSQIEEIEFIEKPKRVFAQVEMSLAASCFEQVLNPQQTQEALRGEGVYVAIIDSGIDYRLQAFRDGDGRTKIDWLWDQGQSARNGFPGTVPEGFAVGTEFSKEEIDANLRDGETEELLSFDRSGHGTGVAYIASQGAPESRFIIVKLDTENQGSYPSTTSLMRAFTYVVRKAVAAGKPVAINLSYGNTYGSHDGTSLLERFIDEISEIGQNVICIGSGNEGASGGHYSSRVESTESVEFAVGNYESELSLQIWKNFADLYEITVVSPGGRSYTIPEQSEDGAAFQVVLEQTKLLIYSGQPQPYRTKEEIYIDFIPVSSKVRYIDEGIWQIRLQPQRIVNGNVQMYLPSEAVRSSATRFLFPNPDATLTIPSTTQKAITVGAYQVRFGAYADFSGRGYAANATDIGTGLTKPDLLAPGVNILVRTSKGQVSVSGTSYAAPFVTAASALLMEWGIVKGKDPFLYGEKVKAYLIRGAGQLAGYEEWPNDMAGWGFLCVDDSIPR